MTVFFAKVKQEFHCLDCGAGREGGWLMQIHNVFNGVGCPICRFAGMASDLASRHPGHRLVTRASPHGRPEAALARYQVAPHPWELPEDFGWDPQLLQHSAVAGGAANAVATHLRYIARDGVTRKGERGQAYGPETDTADLKAFEERGKGDRHQFRFIVSVEDARELGDLRGYTREVMQRMSTDLGTRLDWVAVDHWDTENPRTHIVLRGRLGDGHGKGQGLVIAPDYMAHGMRMRASELATEWLGPRTELEIRQGVRRGGGQERLTRPDPQPHGGDAEGPG